MFKVYCDDTCIYDIRYDDLTLLEPVVTLELNKAGSFSFKIPSTNPYYDLPQKMVSKIEVLWDDAEIFIGRPVSESIDFWNRKTIECDGELAYLNDTVQRPGEYHNYTVRQYLEMLIGNHNSQVDEDKQFTVGIVTVTDSNDSLYRYTNYNSTMDEAKADLVDDLGGYLKVRNEDGYRYIDYVTLEDYGDTNDQVIEFGENLLDFTRNVDSSDILTAIIPLGTQLEESEIEALDMRLTIEDVNDGVDYIQNDEMVEKYGFIAKVVTWDDITTAEYLLAKAQTYLEVYEYENLIIEASAVDLHLTDDDIMRFKLGDKVRVLSKPHDLDQYMYISAMSIHLDSPSSTTVTLGVEDEETSLSAQSISLSSEVQDYKVNKSGLLASAVAQATALITAATHGYIMVNDTDGDGVPDELVIMDTDDTETATNVWRWNLNGLGYSSTGYDGEYGTAITMDGQIVGTYIAAGTIGAEQLTVEYLESVDTEISNALLEGKEYTDEQLTNYYTQEEVSQLFTVNNASLLSEISTIYVTAETYSSGLSETLGSAEAYADEIVSSLETALKEYADSAADSAESDANDYTDTKLLSYSTTAEITTLIEQTQDSILLSVSGTYVTTLTYESGLESAIATSESYADSVAATTLSSAQEYTDTLLTNYSTTTEVESKIEALSDSITLSVSSLTESIAEISADLSSLEVGATNLLLGSRDLSDWKVSSSSVISVELDDDDFGVATFADTDTLAWNYIGSPLFLLSKVDGQEVTVSFWCRAEDADSYESSSGRFLATLNLYTDSGTDRTLYKSIGTVSASEISDEWTRYSYTVTVSEDLFTSGSGDYSEAVYISLRFYNYSLYAAQFKKPKLEIGNITTDWSPAPEDATDYVDTVLLSYYTSEELDSIIAQTSDSILLEVSGTYVTTITYSSGLESTLSSAKEYAESVADDAEASAIASAAASLTDTLTSYYTKTETDSQISLAQDSILLSVSETYVTTATYTTGLSDTLSSAENYTDTILTSYSTTTEVEAMIETTQSSILLSVSETYATIETTTTIADDLSEEVTRATTAEAELAASITINSDAITAEVTRASGAEEELSTLISTTAAGIEATIEDTQSNARTYFAADATSISCSSGTVTFTSNTFAVSSTYFTLTAAGKITATEVSISGAFEAAGDDYWIKIDEGEITGGTSGSSTAHGYLVIDDEYQDTGTYGTSIGGKGMIALRTPKLVITDYSDPGDGEETSWYTGNTQTVYAVTTSSGGDSTFENSKSIYTSYSTTTKTLVSAVTTSTQSVATAISTSYHTLITSYSTFSGYIVSNVSTTTSSGYVTAISQTRTYYTNVVYSPSTSIIYHVSSSSPLTTTSLSYVSDATTSSVTYVSSLTSSTLYYLGSASNSATNVTTLVFQKGLLCSSWAI